MIAASTLLAAPAAMCLAGALHARPPVPDDRLRRLPEVAALLALLASLLAGGFLVISGPGTSPILGLGEIGFSARLDAVSVALAALVAFLGWVLVRFSARHLRDSGVERSSTAWLCAKLGGLLLLATAGHLAQLAAGLFLASFAFSRLLALFASKPAVARAVIKHRLVTAIGGAALLIAAVCVAAAYGTSEIGAILEAARSGSHPVLAQVGAGFLALAAVIFAGLLPAHVWLREVGEGPLPLNALAQTLCVGAGIFVVIRLADVLMIAPLAMAGIAALGGATALVAGFVAATNSSVRAAHTWFSISHSGFGLLLCGLGLFPLALLHLAGHSLHRVHAILAREKPAYAAPTAAPTLRAVLVSMAVALAIYCGMAGVGWLLGVAPQILAVGAILTMGLGCIAAQGGETGANTRSAAATAAILAAGLFCFQWLAFAVTAGSVPSIPAATPLDWFLMLLAFLGFGIAALVQAILQTHPRHPLLRALRVHVANGFYLDALADRLLRSWRLATHRKEI